MKSQDYFEIARWASEIADSYNRPVMHVLMRVHEGLNEFKDVSLMKRYVIEKLEGVSL